MYIKKFENYNKIKLDTRYELKVIMGDEEYDFDYTGDDVNYNPFSLEETVKLYMLHEKEYNPNELVIKQISEKIVPKKTIDDIIIKISSKKYNL